MTAVDTINEKEALEAIHASLKKDGVEITKDKLGKVMDKMIDLSIAGLSKGKGIKMRGLGTIEIRDHAARTYSVPVDNGDGTFGAKIVNAPAGKHIAIEASEDLLIALNSTGL